MLKSFHRVIERSNGGKIINLTFERFVVNFLLLKPCNSFLMEISYALNTFSKVRLCSCKRARRWIMDGLVGPVISKESFRVLPGDVNFLFFFFFFNKIPFFIS